MSSADLVRRLRATFIAELEDQLRQAALYLRGLDQAPDDAEQLRGLFRVMHTLKGASHAAAVPDVERVCHEAESHLVGLRDAGRAIQPNELEPIRRAVDALQHSLEALRAEPASTPTPASPDVARPAGAESTVRVSPRRLDDLLTSSNRLLIATGQVGEVAASMRHTRDTAQSLMSDWRALHRQLRRSPACLEEVGSTSVADFQRFEDRLTALALEASNTAGEIGTTSRDLNRITGAFSAGVRELRLRPFADAVEGLETVVRDVAAINGKAVRLIVDGTDLEADRSVLDHLREALLHLVRNAVDHGIESLTDRQATGKAERGTIRVSARLLGDRILVTVEDDGAGIDLEGIRRVMRARGEAVPDSDQLLYSRMFGGGFSTRAGVGMISGRGVGLDVVSAVAQRMRGSVRVHSTPGAGTAFTIDAPLALATIRAVVVAVSGTLVAIPTAYVERMTRVPRDDVRVSEGRSVILTPTGPVPLVSLGRVLGVVGSPTPAPVATVVIVDVDRRRTALEVDAVRVEQEIVVREIRAQGKAPLVAYSGVALLATGELAFVVNAAAVSDSAMHTPAEIAPVPSRSMARTKRVLVVDDSLTTRTLEQSVLEAAGYDVITAFDGAEGWRVLEERGADVVVADVEMPRMDGLELCRTVRSSSRFRETPFVLITALETPEDRRRGLDAGADAYLGKSSFEREGLLRVIRELIGV